MGSSSELGALAAFATVVAFTTPARAANTSQPRVPPSFLGGSCLTTVDRAVDPVVHFEIGIPLEDTTLTEDEPDDSRTFQFFGLCRAPEPLEVLPSWIDDEDVARAKAKNSAIEPPDPQDVLATSDARAPGCVQTINDDAQRLQITCEGTRDGVDWDARGAPPGAYVVWGYTFEPDVNLWTPRPGVVRVIDGTDDSAGPAVAFSFPITKVDATLGKGLTVAGCGGGAEGTTVELAWAAAAQLAELGDAAWEPFADVPLTDETFAVSFYPPPSARYAALFFRARATDPQGRSFTAFTLEEVVVREGCEGPEGGEAVTLDVCGAGTPPADAGDRSAGACEGGDPPDDEGDSSSGAPADETGDAPAQAGPGAAGCRAAPRPGHPAVLLLLLALVRRR